MGLTPHVIFIVQKYLFRNHIRNTSFLYPEPVSYVLHALHYAMGLTFSARFSKMQSITFPWDSPFHFLYNRYPTHDERAMYSHMLLLESSETVTFKNQHTI